MWVIVCKPFDPKNPDVRPAGPTLIWSGSEYVAAGPLFATETKEEAKVECLKLCRQPWPAGYQHPVVVHLKSIDPAVRAKRLANAQHNA